MNVKETMSDVACENCSVKPASLCRRCEMTFCPACMTEGHLQSFKCAGCEESICVNWLEQETEKDPELCPRCWTKRHIGDVDSSSEEESDEDYSE